MRIRPEPVIAISLPTVPSIPALDDAGEPTEPFIEPVPQPVPRSVPQPVPKRGSWSYRAPLLLWTLLLQLILYSNSGYSWHFFADGGTLLLGGHPPGMSQPGGLHLYANYPQLQFGPLTLLTVVVLLPFTTAGGWLIASWFMTL
ncbi:MAG TPA: hypothetical protein VGN81_27925, partial [Pseudonocardiaceae bacterium]